MTSVAVEAGIVREFGYADSIKFDGFTIIPLIRRPSSIPDEVVSVSGVVQVGFFCFFICGEMGFTRGSRKKRLVQKRECLGAFGDWREKLGFFVV